MTPSSATAAQTLYGCELATAAEPASVLLPGHDVPLGRYTTVRRLLPQRQRRMIGAWCFVDHFGPDDVGGRAGMQVPPHPHTGLQTVTWLVAGSIRHRDSLGSDQLITPGQLNLMTSGYGIAHSEQSPPGHPAQMHGLQLWVALPAQARRGSARFDHHDELPLVQRDDVQIRVVVGEFGGARSPAVMHTPLVGAEIVSTRASDVLLPADPEFEYGVLILTGEATVAGTRLQPGALLYLGPGRTAISLVALDDCRLFLLGGVPFDEPLVMWWNFVGGSHEEIEAARADWRSGRRFGIVEGCEADALPAPPMPSVRLKARDRFGGTH